MTRKRRRTSSGHAISENELTRDSQGRWVRRADVSKEASTQDFVFDDRIIEKISPDAAEPPAAPFFLNDAEGAFDGSFDLAAGNQATDDAATKDDFDSVPPVVESRPEEKAPIFGRILSPASRLLGTALLFGVVLFLFQRSDFGAMRADVVAPPPPPRIVAPVSVTPTSIPAVPEPAATVVSPPPPASKPNPKHLVAGESTPEVSTFSQATADEESRFNLAEEFLQLGDEKQAEDIYLQLFSEGTQKGRAAVALGDLFADRKDFSRAEEYYRSAKHFFESTPQPISSP